MTTFFHCRGLSSEEGCRRLGLNPVALNLVPRLPRGRRRKAQAQDPPWDSRESTNCHVLGEKDRQWLHSHRYPASLGPRSCLIADMDTALVTLWPARRDLGMYN